MIDIELLRQDSTFKEVKRAIAARGYNDGDVDALRKADAEWRSLKKREEELRRQQHLFTETRTRTSGMAGHPEVLRRTDEVERAAARQLRETLEALRPLEEERLARWKKLPNLPLPGVPEGRDAHSNVVREAPPKLPAYAFTPRDYLDVGTALGIVDVERAAVASGTRFGALVGDGARLEFALVQHAISVLAGEGFTPVIPPVLVLRERMDAMGYLDRGADEVYETADGLVLVGTAEQSVGAMHAGHVFRLEDLPARFAAFSSCFRREAGSHGRDVRGILRVHQFDKVEMFSFCHPEKSVEEHTAFLALQQRLMDDLQLPCRVVHICAGDLGFAASAQFDLETWFPSRQAFVETHSTSNTTDFQARRLPVKFRGREGRAQLVHTVNGTAYAIQRTIAALLEVHQDADGSVEIPKALRPFIGGQERLRRERARA